MVSNSFPECTPGPITLLVIVTNLLIFENRWKEICAVRECALSISCGLYAITHVRSHTRGGGLNNAETKKSSIRGPFSNGIRRYYYCRLCCVIRFLSIKIILFNRREYRRKIPFASRYLLILQRTIIYSLLLFYFFFTHSISDDILFIYYFDSDRKLI